MIDRKFGYKHGWVDEDIGNKSVKNTQCLSFGEVKI